MFILAALAVAAALVLGVVLGSLRDRAAIRDRDAAMAAAQAAGTQAAAAAADAHLMLERVSGRIAELNQELDRTRQHVEVMAASQGEMQQQLIDARADASHARSKLATAQQQTSRLAGSPLGDGRYIGRIWAVGASQSPPRLVFDPGQWFAGRAARDAAVADGIIGPNDPFPRHRYFRGGAAEWHTLRLAGSARVTLRTWRGRPGPTVVGIGQLQRAFGSGARWALRAARDPFWITIREGRVVQVQQQPYR